MVYIFLGFGSDFGAALMGGGGFARWWPEIGFSGVCRGKKRESVQEVRGERDAAERERGEF